jgi:hypothetical protein
VIEKATCVAANGILKRPLRGNHFKTSNTCSWPGTAPCASRHRSFSDRCQPREPADPRLRGGENLRSKRSSFRDTINHLHRVQSHSFVDGSRYVCSHQSLANFGSTVAVFGVLQKPMCRHRLDAAIVPRPFILPSASSLIFSPFHSFAFRSAARSQSAAAQDLRLFTWRTCGSTHLASGSRFGRHLDRVCSAISEASRG